MDFGKLKKEVKQLETGGKRNPDIIYFEDDSETYIRLVPMQDIPEELNTGDQLVKTWVHYRSGGIVPNTSFSPMTFNQIDPVIEFVDLELRDRVSKQKFKSLMNMKPSEVYITTAVVRGKEEAGTKLLTLTSGQYKQLVNAIEMAFKPDPVEDISDIKAGYDIYVSCTGKDNSDTGFRKFNFSVNVRKPKPLHTDKDLVDSLIENQPDWREAYDKLSIEQIESYIDSAMEMGEDLNEEDTDIPEDADRLDEVEYASDKSKDEIIDQAEKDFEDMMEDEDELVGDFDDDDDLPF